MMKKKIILGILGICLAFPILELLGCYSGASSHPEFVNMAIEVAPGRWEEWHRDDTDSDPDLHTFISSDDDGDGYYKVISSDSENLKGRLIYYNSRHGFYLSLPKGMGLNQRGESILGAHGNEFYNNDTTLVVSVSGLYYDIVLLDIPEYADTIRRMELDFIHTLSKKPKITTSKHDIIVSEGVIDHSNPENPPADKFIHKWILRKDVEDRETEMSVIIFYNDSLSYRKPEFNKIISTFPDKP